MRWQIKKWHIGVNETLLCQSCCMFRFNVLLKMKLSRSMLLRVNNYVISNIFHVQAAADVFFKIKYACLMPIQVMKPHNIRSTQPLLVDPVISRSCTIQLGFFHAQCFFSIPIFIPVFWTHYRLLLFLRALMPSFCNTRFRKFFGGTCVVTEVFLKKQHLESVSFCIYWLIWSGAQVFERKYKQSSSFFCILFAKTIWSQKSSSKNSILNQFLFAYIGWFGVAPRFLKESTNKDQVFLHSWNSLMTQRN